LVALLLSPAGAATTVQPKTMSENPRVNFYTWANREWLAKSEIPSDQARVDNFTYLENAIYDQLNELFTTLRKAPSRTPEQEMMLRVYDGYSDLPAREKRGIAPIAQDLKAIDAIKTHQDAARRFAEFQKLGIASPLMIGPLADFKDSTMNIAFVVQGGLGMTRDYYSGTDAQSTKQRALYEAFLIDIFKAANMPEAEAKAKGVLSLETSLAAIQWSNVENRDMQKIYNPLTANEYFAMTRDLYGEKALTVLGVPKGAKMVVAQPSFVKSYAILFRKTGIHSWKDYMKARLLMRYAKLLSSQFKKAAVKYEISLGLYAEEKPSWKQNIDYLNNTLGMLVGKAYTEKYFGEKTKDSVRKLVLSIRDEFRASIAHADWLAAETKTKALEKIDAMRFQIGYPEKWKDYSALTIDGTDAVENDRRIALFTHNNDMAKISHPVDDSEWEHAPQEINAFYDPTKNAFVLLAGILQEPFYNASASLAQNYGGIGFVIGHEIGHGFDDQGSRFGPKGNLKQWWTAADDAAYARKRKSLIEQANEIGEHTSELQSLA
jgi:predicted metalloendopeptidase